MSDAMTNREIEDVLTSIRRLVSQEGVRGDGARAAVGRLVLTAAHRVDDAPANVAQAVAGQVVTERATAPITGEQVPSAEQPAPAASATDADDDTDTDTVDARETSFDTMPTPDFSMLEATIAELEAAVAASGTNWEPDGSEREAEHGGGTVLSNVTALYAKGGFMRHAGAQANAQANAAAAPASTAAPEPVVSKPAALETATTNEAPVEKPVEVLTEAPKVAPPDQPATAIDTTVSVDDSDDADTADAIIDEEMLHAMVGQMVREELHGQLGERITLLVRKLVRAEIARALDERKLI